MATRLALVLSLRHIGECTKSQRVARRGFKRITKRKKALAARGEAHVSQRDVQSVIRDESSLIAAEALCEKDISVMGKKLYKAVQLDPTNDFAMQQASDLMKILKQTGQLPS